MKSKYTVILIIFSLFLFQIGCGSKNQKSETETEASSAEDTSPLQKVGFTPNPQVIEETEINTLAINSSAPDFNLPGVDGKFYTLDSFSEAEVLVIIFSCNHCPTAQAYEDRMIQLVEDMKGKSVKIIAISPNAANAVLLDELGYSDMGDSYEEMQIRARDKKYNFHYLYDGDTQSASIKYGPKATPHAFVFDSERTLKYSGRLDNSEKPGTANAEDLRSAIDAVLAGQEVAEATTKTFGCSIKWGWKNAWTKKVNSEWEEKAVSLSDLDEAGVKELFSNKSENLLLINVWATWCGPCIIEYPEFVDIHRMYQNRGFEFVSLTADKMEAKDKALGFLEKKHSALRNYIFSGEDIYKLVEAVDPEWDGALPYTALIEPNGKVVYKKMGVIDPLELKRTIVDHPMIGRYY